MQSSRSIQTQVQRRRICAIQATRRRSSHEISSLDGPSRYGFFGIRTPVAACERTPQQQQQQARYYCNWSRWNHLDHSTRFQPLVSTTWNVHRTGGGGGGQRRAVRVVGSSTASPACPLRNFSRTAGFHHATPPQLSSAAERLLATLEDDDDDEDDDNEEELEFLANQYMSQQQLVPHHHHQQQHLQPTPSSEGFLHDSSSLDLELGEESVWDDVGSEIAEDDFEIIEDEFINDEIARARASTLDEPEPRREINALDMLAHFDPEDPPKTNDLHEMQVWLECEAQKENLLKYQKALDAARKRKDYKSLSLVQKQIVQWFPHLQQEFTQMQRDFLYKPKDSKKKQQQQQQQKDVDEEVDSDDVPSTTTSTKFAGQNKKSYKSYGPYLCSLSPEKLAVITAHEAILKCLLSSENLSGAGGCGGVPFVAVAKRLGEAVEEEVLIHRMLYKRFKEKQAWKTQNKNARTDEEHDNGDELGEATSEQVATRSTASKEQQSDTDDKTQEATTTTDTPAKWVYAASHLKDYLDELNRHGNNTNKLGARSTRYAIRKARQVVEREEEWSDSEKVQLGAALFHVLLENATIGGGPHAEPAFSYEKRWTRKHRRQAFVTLNEKIYNMIVSDDLKSFAALTTRYKPMVVPPKPWKSNDDGGYLWLKADLMRHHGCKIQKEALENADMSTLFDGLNFLGGVAWKINKPILQIAQQCWEEGIKLGDLPSPNDFELPPEPGSPPRFLYKNKNDDDDNDSNNPMLDKDSPAYQQAMAEIQAYRDAKNKFRRIHQKNMDLRSLRCSAVLKLDQAKKFQEFEQLYFPYNVDFRGRAYPVPPHLSNVGSDLCRGLLTFAKAKPLGPRGLFWLKVHLANFAGNDKISFEERAQFIDDNMDKVRASAEYPLGRRDGADGDGDGDDDDDEPWWMQQEDPFQALATCMEIVRAIDSGDPESYMCSLPVHMDGSCNGLQHYAALGRDRVGGKAVNLCATNVPQDVYSGVMHEVIRRVAEEAERKLDFIDDSSDSTLMATDSLSRSQKKALTSHRAAQLVNGLIDRGVVKRTVMTSVYGVTYVGARQQIKEKIESKLEEQGKDIDMMEREIFHACGYLARVTMDVMGDLFTGAKETMNWLTTCARMITQHGYPVAWMSPIGIPAIQPYRQKKTFTLVTLMQTVTLVLEHDDLPLHKGRQVTAFPPNYVHSLDSSHMLLTALEMDRRGLTFSAVHDSFWTHACDVDEMNVALREEFVKLYDQPLLERLKQDWEMRYPDLDFPDLPEHGDLDLNEVKEAPYFFQ